MRRALAAMAVVGLTACKPAGLDRWDPAMRAPDEIALHRLGGLKADAAMEWDRAQTVIADPTIRAEVQALLADEKATWVITEPRSPLQCIFHGDLSIVWKKVAREREAVFCFSCTEIRGSTAIDAYDPKRVAAVAARVFPDWKLFQRVAEGKRPHE